MRKSRLVELTGISETVKMNFIANLAPIRDIFCVLNQEIFSQLQLHGENRVFRESRPLSAPSKMHANVSSGLYYTLCRSVRFGWREKELIIDNEGQLGLFPLSCCERRGETKKSRKKTNRTSKSLKNGKCKRQWERIGKQKKVQIPHFMFSNFVIDRSGSYPLES
jgi:hypothetical protein